MHTRQGACELKLEPPMWLNAVVVTVALHNKAVILTGDPDDIQRLVRASGHGAVVVAV